MFSLPFQRLNLKRNPFGELTRAERAQLAVTDISYYVEKLRAPNFALQIMGEQGRGKTTHLLALKQYFPDAPYVYYAEDEPRPHVPKAPVLFLDETQRFTYVERLRIFKRKASFVIATHQDHSEEFEKAGLEHQNIHLSGITPERLKVILEKRLEASRRAAGAIPYFEDEVIHKLIEHFGDDLRSMEAYLYDIFQSLEVVGAVKLPNA